jgi:hypothetical protein
MAGRLWGLATTVLALSGCDGGEPTEPAAASPSSQCPRVSMDGMAGRWLKFEGSAVKEYRFEVAEVGGQLELWYTGGGFGKRRLVGERRSSDYAFTEMPSEEKAGRYKAGSVPLVRLYVEPRPTDCSLRVSEMELSWKDNKESEKPKGSYTSYIEYPDSGPDLSFRYCDGELFIGEAATDRAKAEEQLARSGVAEPDAALGEALSLGAWSPEQGATDCTYEMKLYFDDQPARDKDGNFRPRLPVTDRWLVTDWYAPYSGNHQFQVYQYKTCGGTETLVGSACLEAVLR